MPPDPSPLLPRPTASRETLLRLRERALARMRQDEAAAGVAAASSHQGRVVTRRWSLQRLGLIAAGWTPAAGALARTQAAFGAGFSGSLRSAAPQYGAPGLPATPARPPSPRPDVTPMQTVTNREDLARPEMWANDALELVVPASPGRPTTQSMMPAKTVLYRVASAGTRTLSVVADPHTKLTYVVRGGQTFYISDDADMIVCQLGAGTLQLKGSIYKTPTSDEGDAAAIARFVKDVDDYRLLAEDGRDVLIDLTPGVPFQFWTRDSSAGSQGATPTVTAIKIADHVMRLDVLSSGGRFRGTFWIDLTAKRLVKSAIDGKELM